MDIVENIEIAKVVRIPLDYDTFTEEIHDFLTEWWFDYSDLKANKKIFELLKVDYEKEIYLLEHGFIDFISVYVYI